MYDKMVYIAWHISRLFNLGKYRKGGNNSFRYNSFPQDIYDFFYFFYYLYTLILTILILSEQITKNRLQDVLYKKAVLKNLAICTEVSL